MTNRHFENVLSDNSESVLNTSCDFWKRKVFDLTDRVTQNASTSTKNTLYTGTTGIAYMFYRLATSKEFKINSTNFLNKAVEILQLKVIDCKKRPGQFICGDAGVNAVHAIVHHLLGDAEMAKTFLMHFENEATIYKPVGSIVNSGNDELFVGRAGYLYGVLWLEKAFGRKIIPDQDIIELCSTIVKSGRQYSKRNQSIFPLMFSYHNKEYLGAAHGLCTILQVLISFPQFIEKDQQTKQDIKKCIDILLSLQTTNGNFPTKVEFGSKQRSEKDELVHWCHGAPGVIYLLAKAYLVFKEPSYLESCLKCGDLVWTKGLLRKGPGLCHGIAGNGYVFLLLYRLTGNKKHLTRAMKFGEFIFTDEFVHGSRKPDHLYSLYEGLAGTVCFLIDLMQPEKANFPFLDVF